MVTYEVYRLSNRKFVQYLLESKTPLRILILKTIRVYFTLQMDEYEGTRVPENKAIEDNH